MSERSPVFPQLDQLLEERVPDVFETGHDYKHCYLGRRGTGRNRRGESKATVREVPLDKVYRNE